MLDHSVAVRILLLIGIFLVGYAEAMILKSRFAASVTWLLALAAACIWIADPTRPIRLAAGEENGRSVACMLVYSGVQSHRGATPSAFNSAARAMRLPTRQY
jgi:hypothetical protein